MASRVGRVTKRTDDRRQRILAALKAGATRQAACGAAGISDQLMLNWMHDELEFLEQVTRAEAECELAMTALVLAAAVTDARHAEWWLERRRSDSYGRRQTLDIDIRARAKQLAAELGLSARDIVAEAERLIQVNAARQ